jgi:hypothetical protein
MEKDMNKEEALRELVSLGNGEFLEEVENSKNPDLTKILDRIHRSILKDARRHSDGWNSLVSSLLKAGELFNTEELNNLLLFEFNLDPQAVGGAKKFFLQLGNSLREYLKEANK